MTVKAGLLILQSGGIYNAHYNLYWNFDMATAYFVKLKKKKLYYQYLGNATPIKIKIAKK